jgi:coproporphyrinogen III oxidase
MGNTEIEPRKKQAREWFESLRDRIVAAFQRVEDAVPAGAPLADRPAALCKHHGIAQTTAVAQEAAE